jgi:3',5'-cyclic AMP phosphodiesterase CpdA
VNQINIKITALFLVSLLCLSHVVFGHEPSIESVPMRFAVIGDRTGGHEPGIYGQIVKEIQRMKPDFVLSVGDMIEGYTDDTVEIKRQWAEYLELIKPFSMPLYLIPGNHDIWNSTSLKLYKRYIGDPYYSFDIGKSHFVMIDNSLYYTDSTFVQEQKEQIEWLINDLDENKDAEYTFVVCHIPYWIETRAVGRHDTLHTIFSHYGVDAVFTGHYHSYFSGMYDNVMYTGVGSSGGACSPGPTGLTYHFIWVTLDHSGISIAPIKMDAVLGWDEVTADD